MFKTLYAKLAAILLALTILLGAVFTWLSFYTVQLYQQEVSQSLNHDLAEHLVSEWNLLVDGEVNREHLEQVFHTLMVANPSIECYLLDNDGKILAYKAPEEKIHRENVDVSPIQQFLAGEGKYPLLGDDPRDDSRQKVFSTSPIVINGKQEGYMYVILGGEDYDNIAELLQNSYIASFSIWVGISSLLLVLFVGLISFALLTRRLKKLTKAVNAFKGSNFRQLEVSTGLKPTTSGDEIDQLGSVFEEMAARIIRHINELHRIDEERREMVGGVSHDLRAPLTTLQGHLETMLYKEQQLSQDERKEFLTVAIKNCHRLGRLIEDLFELAKLDSYRHKLKRERFSLDELILDVVQKFEAVAKKRGITLVAEGTDEISTVTADIGLIERALDNLLSNALTHTGGEGTVTVDLSKKDNKYNITVKDTGVGIDDEDIPHIFEKFYRAKSSLSATSGAGLGLAITKKIVELHGSDIEVKSNVGSGTTFSFSLPVEQ